MGQAKFQITNVQRVAGGNVHMMIFSPIDISYNIALIYNVYQLSGFCKCGARGRFIREAMEQGRVGESNSYH